MITEDETFTYRGCKVEISMLREEDCEKVYVTIKDPQGERISTADLSSYFIYNEDIMAIIDKHFMDLRLAGSEA